jgi:hypothetical protein
MTPEKNGANGSAQPPQRNLLQSVLPTPNGLRLIYTYSDGIYVGEIVVTAHDNATMALIANVFQAFAADHARGLQVATQLPRGQ